MATIKSFSDLQQSKKLAEILPLETADMCYVWDYEHICYTPELFGFIQNQDNEGVEHIDYPCWSIASLLGVLPEKYTELIKEGGMYRIIIKDSYITSLFNNPVDACVAMIEKLHELNLL